MHQRLRIEKLVAGGDGLARDDQGVLFVHGALPGELVDILPPAKRSGARFADIQTIVEPSPERIEPKCRHFSDCGGCELQYMAYPAQLESKRNILMESLARVAKWSQPELANFSAMLEIFSGSEWGYRNRMQFHPGKDGYPALMERGSNRAVTLEECPVAHSRIQSWIHSKPVLDKRTPVYSSDAGISFGEQEHRVKLGDREVCFGADSFFQSNLVLHQRLAAWIDSYLATIPAESRRLAWDLFSGVGTFAIMLQRHFSRVKAVEREPRNNAWAARNGLSESEIVSADVENWIKKQRQAVPDCIVVDPPREGLQSWLREYLRTHYRGRLLYVSCDAVSFSRDLGVLVQAGWRTSHAALFDFYPQTWRIETAVWMEYPA